MSAVSCPTVVIGVPLLPIEGTAVVTIPASAISAPGGVETMAWPLPGTTFSRDGGLEKPAGSLVKFDEFTHAGA